MDDGAFDRPVTIGRMTVNSLAEAGSFLLTAPTRYRRKRAYRVALQAVVRGLGGVVEVEASRQAFAQALAEMIGGKASASNDEGAGGRSRTRSTA